MAASWVPGELVGECPGLAEDRSLRVLVVRLLRDGASRVIDGVG